MTNIVTRKRVGIGRLSTDGREECSSHSVFGLCVPLFDERKHHVTVHKKLWYSAANHIQTDLIHIFKIPISINECTFCVSV